MIGKKIPDCTESFKDTTEFIKLSGELKNKQIKWDKETQDKKRKKFLRNLDNFGGKHVYKWQSFNEIKSTGSGVDPMVTNYAKCVVLTQEIYEQETSWVKVDQPYEFQQRYFTPKSKGHNVFYDKGRGRGRDNYHQSPFRGGSTHYLSNNGENPWRSIPSRGRGQQRGRGPKQGRRSEVSTHNRYTFTE